MVAGDGLYGGEDCAQARPDECGLETRPVTSPVEARAPLENLVTTATIS